MKEHVIFAFIESVIIQEIGDLQPIPSNKLINLNRYASLERESTVYHSISPASRAVSPSIRDAQLAGLPVLSFEAWDDTCVHRYALVLDSGKYPTGPPEWIETLVSKTPHVKYLDLIRSARCDAGQTSVRLWDNDYVGDDCPPPADVYLSVHRNWNPFGLNSNTTATRFDLVPMLWRHDKPLWFPPGVGFSLCAASGMATVMWCKRNADGSLVDERWIDVYDFNATVPPRGSAWSTSPKSHE